MRLVIHCQQKQQKKYIYRRTEKIVCVHRKSEFTSSQSHTASFLPFFLSTSHLLLPLLLLLLLLFPGLVKHTSVRLFLSSFSHFNFLAFRGGVRHSAPGEVARAIRERERERERERDRERARGRTICLTQTPFSLPSQHITLSPLLDPNGEIQALWNR